jgi:hypothetical protein
MARIYLKTMKPKKILNVAILSLLVFLNATFVLADNTEDSSSNVETRLQEEMQQPSSTFVPRITNENLRSNQACTLLIKEFENIYFFTLDGPKASELGSIERFTQALLNLNSDSSWGFIGYNDVLGCAMMTGRIKLLYLNLLLFYVLKMFTVFSGVISMLFIIFGGYKYVLGAITENKDEGKKIIVHAIIGLVICTLAWIIVDIVQRFVTG